MKNLSSEKNANVSRRDFIKKSAGAAVSLAAMTAGTSRVYAAGSGKMKVGLIGCGNRGRGALKNCLEAGKHLKIDLEVVAVGDWFKDKALKTGKARGVSPDRCFGGPEAYKGVIASEADLVVIVTPPIFRPVHFEAAINAGKHVFMEKPVCVDPPGGRKIIAAGEIALQKGLAVVGGTQRRHQSSYRKNQYAVEHGAIGKIAGGCVWWCQSDLWCTPQNPGENDMDYMIRNWVSFAEMSGDHIVEQHVHNIDIANWFIGRHPSSAVGFGGRTQRQTGNQYDFFSVDFDYGEGLHIHSMCRQMSGCYDRVSEFFNGSNGSSWGNSKLEAGKNITVPNFPEHAKGPYVQEHVDLLEGIIKGKPLNEARSIAESTLTGIMGRISAYTGKLVRWSDITKSEQSPWYNLTLKPSAEDFEAGNVTAPPDGIAPVTGKPGKQPRQNRR